MDFTAFLLHDESAPLDEELLEQSENDLSSRDPQHSFIDEMVEKLAAARNAGIKLAREQGMKVLDETIEKNARIFGESVPHTIDHAAIPYEHRRADYEDYLKTKSQEKPSGYLRGVGGGAVMGGGLGALAGYLSHAGRGPSHAAALMGGALGAGIGGLGGAIAAHSDKSKIDSAQKVLKSGKIDKDLADQIAYNHDVNSSGEWWNDERRHQQTLHALREKKAEAEKVAILPLAVGMGARLLGGQAVKAVAGQGAKKMIGGMAKDVAKNVVVDQATSAASNAINRARQPAQQAAPAMGGGFKYAQTGAAGGLSSAAAKLFGQAKNLAGSVGGKGPGSFGQKLVGGMVRNPGAALVGAGLIGGAVMAPRDPVTGEKQYIRGALTGGALGAGAHALGASNKLRHAVVSPKGPQIFGEQAGAYARGATKATSPAAARAAGGGMAAPSTTATVSAAPAAAHTSGPMSGVPHLDPEMMSPLEFHQRAGQFWKGKVANRQTLTYDPATKSFTRTHLTPSVAADSRVSGGGTLASPGLGLADIPAGRTEAVGGHVAEPRGPAPAGLGPSGGQSQVFSSHGGDVMSSAPARGVAARPQVAARAMAAPPPIPVAAMKPKSPIGVGAGAALRAAPKPPALPSLAGARSLVKR